MIDLSKEGKEKVFYGILLPMGLRTPDIVKDIFKTGKGTLSGFYYDKYYDTFEEAKRAMIEGIKDPSNRIVEEAEGMSETEKASKIAQIISWKEPFDMTKDFKYKLDKWNREDDEAPPV
jgi:hypothetical protein